YPVPIVAGDRDRRGNHILRKMKITPEMDFLTIFRGGTPPDPVNRRLSSPLPIFCFQPRLAGSNHASLGSSRADPDVLEFRFHRRSGVKLKSDHSAERPLFPIHVLNLRRELAIHEMTEPGSRSDHPV